MTKPTLKTEITEIIFAALKELWEHRGKKRVAGMSLTMQLYGTGGDLDSLGLVQLLIDVEERVSDQYGIAASLMDEKAMSQTHSPFRTVDSLADYLVAQVDGQHG